MIVSDDTLFDENDLQLLIKNYVSYLKTIIETWFYLIKTLTIILRLLPYQKLKRSFLLYPTPDLFVITSSVFDQKSRKW